jgi:predicted AlkP superfamily pyrophosphatase or phosphodiesterase
MRDRRDRRLRLPSFFVLLALPFLLVSCQSAPPARTAPAAAPAASPAETGPPRKVILLSLDGAAADVLQQLHREGALTAGGFERFFREGQVADRLVPVNPTLTAVNHISLATGYPASQTGIVSNRFHPAGAPFLDNVSGFAAPIETETLWEAVKRQGQRVGVVTWPGVDLENTRRMGDWGMVYVGAPDRASAVVSFERKSWSRMPDGPEANSLDSRSPAQRALAVVGKEGQYGREFELVAVDRTDDGKVNYDAVVPLTPGIHQYLHPGQWGRIPCQVPNPPQGMSGTTFCWIKVLSLDPDLGSARIYFNALFSNQPYPLSFQTGMGEKNLLWPGPPDDHSLDEFWKGQPGIDLATWNEQSDRFTSFFGAALRVATSRGDWNLILGYIPSIDEAGHELLVTDPAQPGYSVEKRDACAAVRKKVWQSVDRELAALLKTVDLTKTVVAVVSDHGMAPVHSEFDPNVVLRDKGVLTADDKGKIVAGTKAYAVNVGGVAEIYVDPAAPDRDSLIRDLKKTLTGWNDHGKKPIARVLTRKEGGPLGLDHPNSGDLILFAADGYAFSSAGLREGKAITPTTVYGMHGYPNTDPRMAGIYMALGAGIKPGNVGNGGTVRSTDVAGRVAQWMGIEKPRPKPQE